MHQEFGGKVALVTGGGSGIGAAISARLARAGAAVVIGDLDEAAAKRVAANLASESDIAGSVQGVFLDVTDPESVRAAVETAQSHFGALHLAVNNAGIGGPNPLDIVDHDLSTFRQVMSVNLEGVFLGLKYQIPAIQEAGGGAIVNMASVMATVAYPGSAPYAASKHGVVGLTKAAALEQAKKGVRINAVGPGFIHTPLLDHYDDDTMVQVGNAHPIGRVGKAEEIAETVVFLLSDKASFTTGSYYTVDGGYTAQ